MATSALKTASKTAIQKTEDATVDLVGNKIPEKITKAASKSTREYPRISVAIQLDETSVQPTGMPNEKIHTTRKAATNH